MSNVVEFTIKGVDKASGAFKSVAGSVTKSTAAMARSAVKATKAIAVTSLAASAAVTLFVNKVADSQDKVAKMGLRLGIATEKLSAYHHAAELGGIRTETFDMALQRMARRVAEAGEGLGEAKGALVELGINAKVLAKLPLDQQMDRVADALEGVDGQANKVRLAFKLFDSEGVSMLQTMENGSESFRAAARDLEFLGGVMTEQGTANAEKYKDSVTRVSAAFGGLSMGIGNELIPMMTGLQNSFADFIANNRERIVAFAKNAIAVMIRFGIMTGQVIDSVRGFFGRLFDVDTFAETITNIFTGFKRMLSGMADSLIAIAPYFSQILVASFSAAWAAFKEFGKGALDHVFDLLTGNDIAKPFSQIIHDAAQAAVNEMGAIPDAFNSITDIVVARAADTGAALYDMFGVNSALAKQQADAMIANMEVFGEVVADTQETIQAKTDTFTSIFMEKSAAFMGDQKGFVEEFAGSVFDIMANTTKAIGDSVGAAIVDGESFAKSAQLLLKQVMKQIISSYVALKIQRVIMGQGAVGLAGANTMATMSAAPWPINMTAPAVATAHSAYAQNFVKAGAHGGLGYVPEETTILVNKGERIVSPKQNRDLTDFLSSSGGGGTTIGSVDVTIHTSASSFDAIERHELEEFIGTKLIPAMDRLDDRGVRPQATERAS